VQTALIPIAGKGTRLAPLTRAVPKALFPLVDAGGRLRAVIHVIVAEALSAGAERVGIVTSPGQEELLRRYFAAADEAEGADLSGRISYILQPAPAGFGDAVARGADFAGRGPLMVLLGDHVYVPQPGRGSCAAQVAAEFDRRGGAAMVAMQDVGAEELSRVGTARGEPIGEGVYRCTDFVEKPDPATAARRLVTPDLPEGRYLAHAGIFVVAEEVFEHLATLSARLAGTGREIQFADALGMLLERHPEDYYLCRIRGRAYDTGTPDCYAAAQAAFRAAGGPAQPR